MIALVPKWAHHYDEFWNAIKRRNLWIIKLRYIFFAALLIFFLGGEFLLDFNLTASQMIAILAIDFSILIYNIIIHYFRKRVGCIPGKFNCLHLSLVQMILDLSALLVLIYYTGTIESPFYIFAIFQMIIGSLIIPEIIVYSIAVVFLICFSAMILMQHFHVISNHYLIGIYSSPYEHNDTYVILFIVMFSSMILVSVYIANKIARQLYKREQQLRESLMKIQEVEDKKQKYIIGVVHELKTPVAAVQSMVDLILKKYFGPVSDAVKEKLERIEQRSSDALTLIHNVLCISRLKLLNLTSTEDLDVYHMIHELLEKRCDEIKDKKLKVDLIDLRKHKIPIQGDKLLIELAFSNIICNASKYTDNGGTIKIEIDENNGFINVKVYDTGIGIPKNELDNIFSEFYRASNVKRIDTEGSGLGLALVKEVVERHYGIIKIESPSGIGTFENPGTAVTIKLPYHSPIENNEEEEITNQDDL